jgi:hypothetical protein
MHAKTAKAHKEKTEMQQSAVPAATSLSIFFADRTVLTCRHDSPHMHVKTAKAHKEKTEMQQSAVPAAVPPRGSVTSQVSPFSC